MRTVGTSSSRRVITEKALVAKERRQDTPAFDVSGGPARGPSPRSSLRLKTIFQVKVDQVRTINFMGKMARRGRFEGRKPSWKKAYVTLKQGEKPVDYGESI